MNCIHFSGQVATAPFETGLGEFCLILIGMKTGLDKEPVEFPVKFFADRQIGQDLSRLCSPGDRMIVRGRLDYLDGYKLILEDFELSSI